MGEASENSASNSPHIISRRKLLRGAAGLAVAGAGWVAAQFTLEPQDGPSALKSPERPPTPTPEINTSPTPIPKEWTPTKEQERQIAEIRQYREKLGFTGLPINFEKLVSEAPLVWVESQSSYEEDHHPKESIPLIEYTKQVVERVFGKHAKNFVRGFRYDPVSTLGFQSESRRLSLGDNFDIHTSMHEYLKVILHEAIGHGSDTLVDTANVYPKDSLILATHGKWRALTQSFSTPGEFFKHPHDDVLPELQALVGEQIALEALKGSIDKLEHPISPHKISDLLNNLATSQKRDLPDIKFSTKACKTLGKELINEFLSQKYSLSPTLYDFFSVQFEHKLGEIYAEMMKYGILHIDDPNANLEVIKGAQEVLDAANSAKVDIRQLKTDISSPSQDIINQFEEDARKKQEAMPKPESPNEIRETSYTDFYFDNIYSPFPGLSTDDSSLFATLSMYLNKINIEFGSTGRQQAIENSDKFHIWEEREIFGAADEGFIRETYMNTYDGIPLSSDTRIEIQRRIGVLKKFF